MTSRDDPETQHKEQHKMYTEFHKQEAKAKRNQAIFQGVAFGVVSLLTLAMCFIIGQSMTI